MGLRDLARTIRTVRYLKFSQIYWRLRYRIGRRKPKVGPVGAVADVSDFPKVSEAKVYSDDQVQCLIEEVGRGELTLLNATREIGVESIDWRLGPQAVDRLWIVHLHSHGWVWELVKAAQGAGEKAGVIWGHIWRILEDWLSRCDLEAEGAGDLAWNSYVVATRIGFWCRILHVMKRDGWHGEVAERMVKSMWKQAGFLDRNIEWDLRANHLVRDAVGLAWAGRFFEGAQAEHWLKAATKLAKSQIEEQVLSDGGHFERSPMYHLQVMEDFYVVERLIRDEGVRKRIRERWSEMAEFAVWMRHPDGQIPLFNDAALNGAGGPQDVLALGAEMDGVDVDTTLRKGVRLFEEYGMGVIHTDDWTVFMDVGPISVDYQPGHGHADTLSIEVSYKGKRLIVDPGTYGYDLGERRAWERGTAAHNAVCVDGEDSSEVWHIFRVGRRASISGVKITELDGSFSIEGEHVGYGRFDGGVMHRRRVEVGREDGLKINDQLTGSAEHGLECRYSLGEGWEAEVKEGGWRIWRQGEELNSQFEGETECELENYESCSEFGSTTPASLMKCRYRGSLPANIGLSIQGNLV